MNTNTDHTDDTDDAGTTRHVVYAVTSTGRVARVPFASMPTQVARRYVAAHPDARLRFVPPLPVDDADSRGAGA